MGRTPHWVWECWWDPSPLGYCAGFWGRRKPGSQLGPSPRSGRLEEIVERVLCLREDPTQMGDRVKSVICRAL